MGFGSPILTEIRSVLTTKDPKSILKIMHRCIPGARPRQHQDSAEFLDKLLEKLSSVIPVNSLFGVSRKETSTCPKGNHGEGSSYSNNVPDEELIYRVTVPNSPTELQDIVNDSMNKTSKYPCRVCGGEDKYFNDHRTIIRSSEYLLIQLKRSDYGKAKNQTEVLTSDYIYFNQRSYKIIGAIEHIGEEKSSGHYTSQVYFQDQWSNIDDEHINEIARPRLGNSAVLFKEFTFWS